MLLQKIKQGNQSRNVLFTIFKKETNEYQYIRTN